MPFSTFLLIWICLHPVVALAQQQAAPQGSQPATAPTPATQEAEENRQKEAEETKRLTELYLRNQNVFLRKNEVMIELDTFYNRNSQQNLIPVTGGVALVQTTRRFVDNTIIARYGFLTDGLEVDLIAPVFVHAEVENNFGTETTTQEENGFGDLAAAIRYQVWYERGNRPSLVLDVEGKSRTGGNGLLGTGTWNAGGGVTLIKSIDPVVFFGRIGYTYNFASQSRDLGNIFDIASAWAFHSMTGSASMSSSRALISARVRFRVRAPAGQRPRNRNHPDPRLDPEPGDYEFGVHRDGDGDQETVYRTAGCRGAHRKFLYDCRSPDSVPVLEGA